MRYTEVRGEVRIGDDIKLGVILNKYLKLRLDEIQLRSKRKETPSLALLVVMLSKAHLTLHSRMSCAR